MTQISQHVYGSIFKMQAYVQIPLYGHGFGPGANVALLNGAHILYHHMGSKLSSLSFCGCRFKNSGKFSNLQILSALVT